MSPEDNKKIVRRYYEEVVNTGNVDRIADFHLTIEQQIAEGDWVVTRITPQGTHQGEWLGIQPTGKAVAFTGGNIDKVADGRIVEHGGAANLLEPLLEIGTIQVVGS